MGFPEQKSSYDQGKKDGTKGRKDFIAYGIDEDYQRGYDYGEGLRDGSQLEKDRHESAIQTFVDALWSREGFEKAGKSEEYKRGYDRGKATYGKRYPPHEPVARKARRERREEKKKPRGEGGVVGGCLEGLVGLLALPSLFLCIVLLAVGSCAEFAWETEIKPAFPALTSYIQGTRNWIQETRTRIESLLPTIDRESIYVVDVYSGSKHKLASGREPVWSPDGRKIAFTRQGLFNHYIYVADVDGSNQVRLVPGGYSYTWSPDSRKIVAVGGVSHLVVVSVDGGSSKEILLGSKGSNPSHPAWSPDGRRIAFAAGGGRTVWSIYVTNLTDNRPKGLIRGEVFAWSPDGTKIAAYENQFLRVINIDGSKEVTLSDTGGAWDFEWLPSTISVVFSAGGKMYVANLGHSIPILSEIGKGTQPSWSPDGLRLAFKNGDDLYIRNIWSKEETKITQAEKYSRFTWSPDGKKLAFTTGGCIHLVNADGSNSVHLAEGCSPAWSPDSRKIAFTKE